MNPIIELLNEIEKRFPADMSITAGLFNDGTAKTVSRGQAIFAKPEDWAKFRLRWEKKAAAFG